MTELFIMQNNNIILHRIQFEPKTGIAPVTTSSSQINEARISHYTSCSH